jgi:radical SAM protein with 4Fe4S-binding SPASM domain
LPKGESDFINYRSSKSQLKRIYDYLDGLKLECPILYRSLITTNEQSKNKNKLFFQNRVLCTANHSHLFILPDGKVTICEQLYWNPRFIVGDLTKQSISDVWNSNEAKNLYYLTQDRISKESHCSICNMFQKCREELGGVCWKETIAAYGDEKWDYPDPNCPFSPTVTNQVFIK